METTLLLIGGLVGLVVGGEFLVRGASKLAAGFGISSLVIGLTVVAFGTSSPELAVSLSAGLKGNSDIAVANVVGSNIFNVLLILGLSALIVPLVVVQQLVRLEVPIMIGASVLFLLFSLDHHISPWEGAVLFALIVVYTVWAIRRSRRETAAVKQEYEEAFGGTQGRGRRLALHAVLVVAGLAILAVGARAFITGAIAVAKGLGVDDVVIGLTLVAAGTSLPEVAASVIAAMKGERDIAIGNVVGSNIFNLLCILGLSGMITPGGLEVAGSMLRFDIPIMLAVAVGCLPVFLTGYRIDRWEGWLFLAMYVAYTVYLILDSAQHAALPAYSKTMLLFVLPLAGVTLAVSLTRELRRRGTRPA